MADNHRSGLRSVVIHRSLWRPMLFMGGERTLVILSMLVCGYMAYLIAMRYSMPVGIGLGGGLWLCLLGGLRRMAIADPYMWKVIMRARRYRASYPARGRFNAPLRAFHDFK